MTSSLAPRHGRLYQRMAADAAAKPRAGPTGRDAYCAGHGRMHGKLAGLVPVAAGAGPEYDVTELVTYLNDAVLLAPSMLLALPVTWALVNDTSFDLTLADAGHQVTARVLVDGRGAPAEFSTEDRWCARPDGLARTRWSTPVQDWMKINGRWQPRWAAAIWHLPDGPFCCAELRFTPGAVRYNVTPAELTPHQPGGQVPGDDLIPGPAAASGSRP